MKKVFVGIIILIILVGISFFLVNLMHNNSNEGTEEENICTSDYEPVCGSDGITYKNDCYALNAGARIEHIGECGINLSTDDLDDNKIKNTTHYISAFEQYVEFEDGYYYKKTDYESLAAGIYNDLIAYGDLDNDGMKDAAVIIYSSGGGTGNFIELEIFLNDFGYPVYWASEDLGDRTIINSIEIDNGTIVIDAITHGEDEPACCPTVPKIFKYKLEGLTLTEKSE